MTGNLGILFPKSRDPNSLLDLRIRSRAKGKSDGTHTDWNYAAFYSSQVRWMRQHAKQCMRRVQAIFETLLPGLYWEIPGHPRNTSPQYVSMAKEISFLVDPPKILPIEQGSIQHSTRQLINWGQEPAQKLVSDLPVLVPVLVLVLVLVVPVLVLVLVLVLVSVLVLGPVRIPVPVLVLVLVAVLVLLPVEDDRKTGCAKSKSEEHPDERRVVT